MTTGTHPICPAGSPPMPNSGPDLPRSGQRVCARPPSVNKSQGSSATSATHMILCGNPFITHLPDSRRVEIGGSGSHGRPLPLVATSSTEPFSSRYTTQLASGRF